MSQVLEMLVVSSLLFSTVSWAWRLMYCVNPTVPAIFLDWWSQKHMWLNEERGRGVCVCVCVCVCPASLEGGQDDSGLSATFWWFPPGMRKANWGKSRWNVLHCDHVIMWSWTFICNVCSLCRCLCRFCYFLVLSFLVPPVSCYVVF